jgi:hypothetical protein
MTASATIPQCFCEYRLDFFRSSQSEAFLLRCSGGLCLIAQDYDKLAERAEIRSGKKHNHQRISARSSLPADPAKRVLSHQAECERAPDLKSFDRGGMSWPMPATTRR